MSFTRWLIVTVAVYVTAVLALVTVGRRSDARALAGFIPDCLVLVERLLRDPRVPRRRKLLLVLLVAYLAMPIDLVPTSSLWPASSMTPSSSRWCCEPFCDQEATTCCRSTGAGRRDHSNWSAA